MCNTIVQIMQTFNWQFQLVEEGAEGTSILASIAHPFAILFIRLDSAYGSSQQQRSQDYRKRNVVGTLAVVYGVTNLIDTDELALVEVEAKWLQLWTYKGGGSRIPDVQPLYTTVLRGTRSYEF